MERNNWNNRNNYRDNRNERGSLPERDDRRSADEDQYRGAYRFDTTSNHRNETTWDGFGSTDRNNSRGEERFRDNNTYRSHHDRGYDHDNYSMNSRWRNPSNNTQGNRYSDQSNSNWGDQNRYRNGNQGNPNQQHRSVHDRIEDRDPYGTGNFNGDYRRDSYGNGNGENYGNEAGSLSYGYDGSSNYDPDWNNRYNPLSGERSSYHGHYTSRHPDREQFGQASDRRNSWRDDDRY